MRISCTFIFHCRFSHEMQLIFSCSPTSKEITIAVKYSEQMIPAIATRLIKVSFFIPILVVITCILLDNIHLSKKLCHNIQYKTKKAASSLPLLPSNTNFLSSTATAATLIKIYITPMLIKIPSIVAGIIKPQNAIPDNTNHILCNFCFFSICPSFTF